MTWDEAPSVIRDLELLTVVVPMWNEGELVTGFLDELLPVLWAGESPFEVILVDDGSHDHTWQSIREASDREPRVRGLSLSRNFGKDAAIFAGLRDASGSAVIVMDGARRA